MPLGPLPDCEQCQKLRKALDEAYRLKKQAAIVSLREYSGETFAVCSADNAFFPNKPAAGARSRTAGGKSFA
jgi:hypothetical protein